MLRWRHLRCLKCFVTVEMGAFDGVLGCTWHVVEKVHHSQLTSLVLCEGIGCIGFWHLPFPVWC